jgi:membrane protein
MAAEQQTRAPQEHRDSDGRAPEGPTHLRPRSWLGVLKRTAGEFRKDNLTDWAAALTYYGILAIFPALLVLVAVLGVIGESATQPLLDNLATVAPGPAQDIFTSAIENLNRDQGQAGILLIIGIATALWSASSYVGAFIRASNAIYEVEEGRPFWKLRPIQIAITLVMILLVSIGAVAVVVTGPLAEAVGNIIGLGSQAVTAWDIAKWPVLVLLVSLMFSVLYWAAPNVKQPGFRWITPGSVLGVILWIAASAGFAFYVASFGSYNETYGSIGGVIVFLVWLWISNIALLLGAEFNAELERGRELEAGQPAEREFQLEPREAPKH